MVVSRKFGRCLGRGAVWGMAAVVISPRRDVAYALVILWALAGISLKQAAVTLVVIPTWITFGLVALTLGVAIYLHRLESKMKMAA